MRGISRVLRRASGFTVIETLIALSLLIGAIIPLAVLLQVGLRTTVTTSTRMHAREVASSEIDKAKSMTFDAIGNNTVATTYSSATNGQQVKQENGYPGMAPYETVVSAGVTYSVTRDVRKVINTSRANSSSTKEIIITVSWSAPEPAGSIKLSTIVGRTDMTGS